jgi:hypothetical protein
VTEPVAVAAPRAVPVAEIAIAAVAAGDADAVPEAEIVREPLAVTGA